MLLILLWRDVLLQSRYQPGSRLRRQHIPHLRLAQTVVADLRQRVVGMDLYGEVARRIQELYQDRKMAIKIAHHRITQQGRTILGYQFRQLATFQRPVGQHRLLPALAYHLVVGNEALVGLQLATAPQSGVKIIDEFQGIKEHKRVSDYTISRCITIGMVPYTCYCNFHRFIKISQTQHPIIGIDTIGTQCPQMVAHYPFMTTQTRRREAPYTHRNKIDRYIMRFDAIYENKTKQALKISCHIIGRIKHTILRIN